MIKYLKKILRNCLAIYRNEGSVALFKTLYILGVLKIKNVFVYPFKYQKYCSKIKSIISRQHYKRMFYGEVILVGMFHYFRDHNI